MAKAHGALRCAAVAAALGCGGGSPPGDGLGLPRASTVVSLTPAQGAHLCDWINQEEGGYGRTVNCVLTGPVATNLNQNDCVMGLPILQSTCPVLTVGDLEDCSLARGTDLCKYYTAAACAPLRACFCVP
jgi:hypothetical protein